MADSADAALARYNLPDRPLIVGVPPIPPYINPCAVKIGITQKLAPNCTEYPGIDFEIFNYIVNILNISVQYHHIPVVNNWGTTPYNGLLKEMSDGKFDTMNTWYRINDERLKVFSYTFNIPYKAMKWGFIISKPGQGMSLEAGELLYRVFQPEIWIATIVSLLVVTLLWFIVANFVKWRDGFKLKSLRDLDYRCFWDAMTIVVDQFNADLDTRSMAGNMLVVTFGFTILFIVTLYEGGLVGSLMRNSSKIPFSSMTELAHLIDKGQYKLMYDGGVASAFFWGLIRESKFSAYRALNKSMTPQTTVTERNITKLLDLMEADPTLVYPGQDLLSGEFGLLKGRCKLMFIEDNDAAGVGMTGFIFRRNDPFLKPISETLAGMSSMVHMTEQKYITHEESENRKLCPGDAAKEGDPLVMKHFFGIIAICAMLLALAAVSLVFELGFHLLKQRLLKRWNQRQPVFKQKVNAIARLNLSAAKVRQNCCKNCGAPYDIATSNLPVAAVQDFSPKLESKVGRLPKYNDINQLMGNNITDGNNEGREPVHSGFFKANGFEHETSKTRSTQMPNTVVKRNLTEQIYSHET